MTVDLLDVIDKKYKEIEEEFKANKITKEEFVEKLGFLIEKLESIEKEVSNAKKESNLNKFSMIKGLFIGLIIILITLLSLVLILF